MPRERFQSANPEASGAGKRDLETWLIIWLYHYYDNTIIIRAQFSNIKKLKALNTGTINKKGLLIFIILQGKKLLNVRLIRIDFNSIINYICINLKLPGLVVMCLRMW